MSDRLPFVRGIGWVQDGQAVVVPQSVHNELGNEIANLTQEIKNEADGVPGNYVGNGGGIYNTVLSWLNSNTVLNQGPNENVYDWISGAAGVNAKTSFSGVFIQDYTASGYAIRLGGSSSDSTITNRAQLSSNNIALNLATDIYENGNLPDIEGIGVLDAGAAATTVFKDNTYLGNGDYAGWAGTLLFPYLGEQKLYNDFLLDPNQLTLAAPTGSVVPQPTDTVTYKHISGAYDLFASVEASIQATKEVQYQFPQDIGGLPLLIGGVSGVTTPDQNGTINETNNWVKAYYSLSGRGLEFLPGHDLVFSGYYSKNVNYDVGILNENTMDLSKTSSVKPTVIVGGPSNDTILGTMSGDDLIDGGNGDNTIFAGGGNDTVFGGGSNNNIITGNIHAGAKTSDLLVGGGGNSLAADAVLGFKDPLIVDIGSDTITSGNGSNIIIGTAGSNTFNVNPIANSSPADNVNIIWGNGGASVYNLSNAAAYGKVSVLYLPGATAQEVAGLKLSQFDTGSGIPDTVIINPNASDTLNLDGKSLSSIVGSYNALNADRYMFVKFREATAPYPQNASYSGLFISSTDGTPILSSSADTSDTLNLVETNQDFPSNPTTGTLFPGDLASGLSISGVTDGLFGIHMPIAGLSPLSSVKTYLNSTSSPGTMAPFQGSGVLSGADTTVYNLSANQGVQTVDNLISATASNGGTVAFGPGVQASDLAISVASKGSTDVLINGDGTILTLTDELGGGPITPITAVTFADGTSLSYSAILTRLSTPSATNQAIYGDGSSNVLDSKGLATYAQGGGGGDTFVYNTGYGQLEINERDSGTKASNALSLGVGISSTQLTMSSDASGNLYLIDGVAGDQIKIDQQFNGSSFGVQEILFADGTTISTVSLDPASLTLQNNTGTIGPDSLYGAYEADVFDGKGAPAGTQDYEQGSGGADTFVFDQGYGHLEISEASAGILASVLQFGPGVTAAQMRVSTDSSGALYLTDGTTGDQIKLDNYLDGSSYGPQTISFADGTSLTQAQVITQAAVGTTGADGLYGSTGADTLDGEGAPAGLQDYEQGNGGNDTFIYNQGYGQLEINEVGVDGDASVLQFGQGITAAQVQVVTDKSGNLTLTDGVAGDKVTLDDYTNGSAFGPQTIAFADGTVWTQNQILAQLTTGTTGADNMYGTSGADTFDGKGAPLVQSGSFNPFGPTTPPQDYEQGNGGADTFVYDQGYGQLEINAYSSTTDNSTLQLGAGITGAQLQITTDPAGNVYLADGTTGDLVKLDGYLFGVSYGPQNIVFADGSTWTQAQVLVQATIGTAGADTLYGTSGADTFDGQGAPAGTQDFEQGNGGADTFVYNQGYGQLEISEQGSVNDASLLQLGAGITAANMQVTANNLGDVILSDGTAGDQITIDNYLDGPANGPQTISFADGTVWGVEQIVAYTTQGTPGADSLYGSSGAETFDGKGAPFYSNDYEQGDGGADTFIYNQGYGNLEIKELGSSSDASVLQFGSNIDPSQVQVVTYGSADNIILTDGVPGDQITIDGYRDSSVIGPQTVAFSDGTVWTKAQIVSQLTTGSSGADTIYGTRGADVIDGEGAPTGSQDYVLGNGGADTFIYNQGYGQLEINEYSAYNQTTVLQIGPSITPDQIQITADRAGDLILTDGTTGDQVKIDQYLTSVSYNQNGGSSYGYGVANISFADGAALSWAQVFAQENVGTVGADNLFGTTGNDLFDGKGAPAGEQDYEQGSGGADTFVYNQGYGQLEIDENGSGSDANVLQLGSGITADQLQVTTDGSGDVVLGDGVPGDQIVLDNYLSYYTYGPQIISFADGTNWTRAQVITQTTTGTTGADLLYGTPDANSFDGKGAPSGSQDYEQGNGGADTFIYNQGYGKLEINESVGYGYTSAVLQLGNGITSSQLTAVNDGSGDIVLSDGIAGDQIKIDNMLTVGYFGNTPDGVNQIQFSDGSSITRQQILAQLTTGTAAANQIYGTTGADIFDGKGAPSGTQDYEQGNGGADTFVYNQGYGALEVNEDAGLYNTNAVLQLGAGITEAQLTATSDTFGNLTLYDGTAGDGVIIDKELNVTYYGSAEYGISQIQFADGSILNSQQVRSLAATGTTGADRLFGTHVSEVFDGKGAPAGLQDYEQGNDGADTFVYDQGYGQLEINEEGYYVSGSVLQLGAGITSAQLHIREDSQGSIVLTDGTANDQIKLDGYLDGSFYNGTTPGPQTISFADGTSWTQAQLIAQAISQTSTMGTTGADILYGTTNVDTFDGQGAPAGSQDYEQGNGGADTFIYNQGYGHLDINEDAGAYTNSTAVLQFGPGTTSSQITATSDAGGDLTLLDGTTGDQVTIDKMTNVGYYGTTEYGVAQAQFADGSTLTYQQLTTLANTGTPGVDSLYGSTGPENLDGQGAPAGSQDYVQGNGGADTFVYNIGYGQLEINEDAGSCNNTTALLQLGASISPGQITALADSSGNIILTDTVNGDQIKIDGMMNLSYGYYTETGVAQLHFADGTSWTQSQLSFLASTGTTGADTIIGTSGNDVIDGRGGADMVSGNGGYDTYLFRQGYGALTIDNSSAAGMGPQGAVDFGPGITEQNLWFTQSGNNLLANVLGSQDVVDIKGWFSNDPTAQLAEIKGFDGMKLDTQVPQLVAAMASYQSANPGFDPTVASSMPSDPALRAALASAWHS